MADSCVRYRGTVFDRYSIRVETGNYGNEVVLQYRDVYQSMSRRDFEECLHNDRRARYVIESMMEHHKANEAKRRFATIPPVGWDVAECGQDGTLGRQAPRKRAPEPKKTNKVLLLCQR